MTVVRLVRHGQASFGAGDYDRLSGPGSEQAQLLGAALRASGNIPSLIISGAMRRQQETAAGILGGLGADVAVETDPAWDEFDHRDVLTVHQPRYRSQLIMKADFARTLNPAKAFQRAFDAATARWIAAPDDGTYRESFTDFTERVSGALAQVRRRADSGDVLVVSSAGPIALLTSQLLSAGTSLWPRLVPVVVNTGVTKVVVGKAGLSLVTFNGHDHLDHDPRLRTYR